MHVKCLDYLELGRRGRGLELLDVPEIRLSLSLYSTPGLSKDIGCHV